MDKHVNNMKIVSSAFVTLLDNLHNYGNTLSVDQRQVLKSLLKTYTDIASGNKQGRYAFGIPTGGGKSQSIVAWITALAMHNSDISVAVSASKVEALCDLKRDIEENLNRIGASISVGILHSYKYDKEKAEGYLKGDAELPSGYASEPCSDTFEDKQILLCTHAKIRGRADIDQYNSYQGEPRDILIYDESLLVSDTRAIDIKYIQAGIGYLEPLTKDGTKREALDYIKKALTVVLKELSRQETDKAEPRQITLPRLTEDEIKRYKAALSNKLTDNVQTPNEPLINFLNISQESLRVLTTDQGNGCISYDIVVPPELNNIVVLDASHNIRELVKLDKSIEASRLDFQVSHENTTVKHLKYFAGRHTMTNSFSKRRREDRKVCLEISEAVKSIPENEGVIIFTFKARDKRVNFREILEDDLYKSGIDTEALIDGKPRFIWLTWGDETSHSKYSYCKHVILAGVLHRSSIELGSAIAGQMDNLQAEINIKQIQQVTLSECAHSVYQAYSRSASRIINHGKTSPATLWMLFNDEGIRDYLDIVMPQAKWELWEPVYLKKEKKKGTKVEEVAEAIKRYLEDLPEAVRKVSTQKVKKGVRLTDIPNKTFQRAVQIISDATVWQKDGRSLIRVF